MLADISEEAAALTLAQTINHLQVQCGLFPYEFTADIVYAYVVTYSFGLTDCSTD